MTRTAISKPARDVLRASVVDGCSVFLPDRQLDRKLYLEVNEVLSRIGGKWKGGNTKAHLFPDDPADDLATVIDSGEMPSKNPTAFVPTPSGLAIRVVALAGGSTLNRPEIRILEPSAGTGAIAEVVRTMAPKATLDLVELLPKHAETLRGRFGAVTEADFLEFSPLAPYDAVVMNPPFSVASDRQTYIEHIARAFSFLKPQGTLVAIAPSSLSFRTDARTRALRDRIESSGGTISALPSDSFAESGTGVNTVIVTMKAGAQ